MPYAIRNRRTKKWWYGTDYITRPERQQMSTEKCYLFDNEEFARLIMISRGMTSRTYEIVKVKIVEVEEDE